MKSDILISIIIFVGFAFALPAIFDIIIEWLLKLCDKRGKKKKDRELLDSKGDRTV